MTEKTINFIISVLGATRTSDKSPEYLQACDYAIKCLEAKEKYDRMAPIYNNKESFESALAKAWKFYNKSGSRTVDSCEDNYIECVFSKGFREGFLYKEKQKEPEKCPEYCVRSHCIGCSIYEKQKAGWKIKSLHPAQWTKEIIDEKFKELVEEYHKQKPKNYNEYQVLIDGAREDGKIKGRKEVIDHPDEYGLTKQKPADDKAFEEWIDDWWKHNKVNNPDSYNKGDEIQFDERGFKNFCRGIRNMYQQKPAEWKPTEEQFNYLAKAIMTLGEKGDCRTAGVLGEIRNGLKCSFPDWKVSSDYPKEGCNVSLNGEIKKIQESKQEWSKEDEMYLSQAIETLEFENYLILAEKLKSIRLKPKQEWNENDKNKLYQIIEILLADKEIIHREDPKHYDFLSKAYDELISWLKSLSPQYHGDVTMTEAYKMGKEAGEASRWKPSEEQMTCLCAVVDAAIRKHYESVSGYKFARVLKSLYEQLKKLM